MDVADLPTEARLHRVVVLLPNLFRPVETRLRNVSVPAVQHKGTFSGGNAVASYQGPQLSGLDLWVLQAVLAEATSLHDSNRASRDPKTGHMDMACSFNRLGQVMGHASAGQLKTNASLEASLARLQAGKMSWSEDQAPAVMLPMLSVIVGPGHASSPQEGVTGLAGGRRKRLCLRLHPLLAEGVAAVGQEKHHLKLQMSEVRALKAQSTRLLHHRLTQSNLGVPVEYGRDTLTGYIAATGASRHQQRRLNERLDAALNELEALGWTIQLMSELTVSGVLKYKITRLNPGP